MRILTFLLIVFTLATVGCNRVKNVGGIAGSGNLKSESRNLSGFKKINAGGAVKLDVTVQKDFAVIVEADDNLLQHVTTEVGGDSLIIGSHDRISPSSQIKVTVSLPELSALDVSGASTATVVGATGDDLKLNASGASKIKVDGEAKELSAIASGASNVDAEGLKAENVEADASGASTVIVNAFGKADLNASGASTAIYVDDPKELKQNSSGASTIRKNDQLDLRSPDQRLLRRS
jgi:hypothetical protein